MNEGVFVNENQAFEMCNNGLHKNHMDRKQENVSQGYSKELHYMNMSMNTSPNSYHKLNNQMNCTVPSSYNVPMNEFY